MQGKVLKVGDKVALIGFSNANSLTIGIVKKLHKVRADVEYQGLWSTRKTVDTINTRGLIKIK